MSSEVFPHLFQPLDLRGLRLRNRINMAPMVTNYGTSRGEVTDRLIAYYAARAHGGAGLITLEATVVSPNGRSFTHNVCIYDDAFVPGLTALAEAVHAGGAKLATELYHAGRRTSTAVARSQPVGPSAVPPKGGETPRELSRAEIEAIQADFVRGARRAKAAGFDAVTLHAAHGYLINAFLSPLANKRTDRYGGDLAGRARFGLEIAERVRAEVGDDFPVLCRVSGSELIDGGLDLADMRQVAAWYEAAGIDAIDVSAGTIETAHVTSHYMMYPRGLLVPLAAGIKQGVSIPVFAVGRINNPEMAEGIIAEGKADAVTMGRALIADPELPNKARAGQVDDITPCIACNQGCLDRVGTQADVACLVNPTAGREQYATVVPAERKRKVAVIGGGLAGMEAAWTARRRGHEVDLYERDGRLGGQFHLAGAAPGKEEIHHIIAFLANQVEKSGVRVHLHSTVTPEMVDGMGADAVVVATGARPISIPVPGADLAVRSWDVLSGAASLGKRVVVVGGGQVGCETAEYLAERGHQVTVLEMLPEIAADMSPRTREPFLLKLMAIGINFYSRAAVTGIGKDEVTFDRAGLPEKVLGVDSVVMAVGSRADARLAETLKGKPYPVRLAGDCVKSRRGLEAIHEGFAAGAAI
ncbi:MAG: FAD-dependent oxidoreductase [Chloroflexota bacterium]